MFNTLTFCDKLLILFDNFKARPVTINLISVKDCKYFQKRNKKIIRINVIDTYYFRLLITLQLQEQLELLVETHQLLDLEGSCERYARALLPYLGLNGLGYQPKC